MIDHITKPKIVRLPANTTGKDWIVGDIHGHVEDVLLLCKAVGVDPDAGDRVFSVGDIIDRGPMSKEAFGLAKLPGWHILRGNHEQMMAESILQQNLDSTQCWLSNGGAWITEVGVEDRETMAHRIATRMPYGIFVVGDGDERFYIAHAEIVISDAGNFTPTDAMFDCDSALARIDLNSLQWGRRIYQLATTVDGVRESFERFYKNMSTVYVGHTMVAYTPHLIGNHMYLDTGCCKARPGRSEYERFTLTIACHQTQMYYQWDPLTKQVIRSGPLPQR